MNDFDIGWSAGVVDGEGSVTSSHILPKRGVTCFRIWVRVSNTNRDMVEKLKALWSGSIHTTRQNSSLGYKPIHVWSCGSKTALAMLMIIEPHLIVKRTQAQIAIELQQRICSRIGYSVDFHPLRNGYGSFYGSSLTQSEIDIRRRLHLKMKELNARRVPLAMMKPLLCHGTMFHELDTANAALRASMK